MTFLDILTRIGKALDPFMPGQLVEKASRTVQGKADDYIARHRSEFVSHAKTEAERFMAEQILMIEARIDEKIAEIERKIDEQIEKEVRHKLQILIYTLVAVILMSLVSLGYLYLKKEMGI